MFFFQATIDCDGFSMVLTPLGNHHWMFLEGPTIGFNGFSIVFEILRAMVNDCLEVNNGLHVPLHKKVRKILRTTGGGKLEFTTKEHYQDWKW